MREKAAKVETYYKLTIEPLSKVTLIAAVTAPRDDDPSAVGDQVRGEIPVLFSSAHDTWDIFHVSISRSGVQEGIKLEDTGLTLTTQTALLALDTDVTLDVDTPAANNFVREYDTLKIGNEFMVVTNVVDVGGGTTRLTLGSRRAHGSALESHGVSSTARMFTYPPSISYELHVNTGLDTAFNAPVLSLKSHTEAVDLKISSWSATSQEELLLREFRVHYSKSTPVTTADPYVPLGRAETLPFTPVIGVNDDIDTSLFYFAATAVPKVENATLISPLSNEESGQVLASIVPNRS